MSPTSAGGFVRRAAPEPNKRALYVGGLDVRVTEDILKQIFETTGHVISVKIIPDKNVSTDAAPGSCCNYIVTLVGLILCTLLTSISLTAKDITTGLSSLMIPVLLREPCRLSMDDVFTSRYVKVIHISSTNLTIDTGNPRELGLPVDHHQQGGYLESLPYLRR